MAAVIFAAYLLITELADIGFRTSLTSSPKLNSVDRVAVSWRRAPSSHQVSRCAEGSYISRPPLIVLQSALKFINLTVPSSAGRVATNLRCLQQMGAPRGEALAGGAIDDLSNTIVQATLFLLVLPFVGVDIDTSQFEGAGPIGDSSSRSSLRSQGLRWS